MMRDGDAATQTVTPPIEFNGTAELAFDARFDTSNSESTSCRSFNPRNASFVTH